MNAFVTGLLPFLLIAPPSSFQKGNRSFRYKVVSIQVVYEIAQKFRSL